MPDVINDQIWADAKVREINFHYYKVIIISIISNLSFITYWRDSTLSLLKTYGINLSLIGTLNVKRKVQQAR